MLKLRKNKKGFTLVELIVVIAIMAVLAGTVAGVTVSQLNKNTDKTMGTEAKGVADFISTWIIENNIDLTTAANLDAVKDSDGTTLMQALQKQYGDKVAATKVKGKTLGISFANKTITVEYEGKTNNGSAKYTIDSEGIVKKVEA